MFPVLFPSAMGHPPHAAFAANAAGESAPLAKSLAISSIPITRIARISPSGLRENLQAPCRRSAGNRQRVHPRPSHEIFRLIRVGQQPAFVQLALDTRAGLFPGLAGLQKPRNPQLALDARPHPMGRIDPEGSSREL